MGPVMVVSTYPDRGAAEEAARTLVREGACACVSMADVRSTYSWKGRVVESPECLALFKTASPGRELLRRRIAETHPYEVPEIAELAVDSVNAPYLQWLAASSEGVPQDGDDAP